MSRAEPDVVEVVRAPTSAPTKGHAVRRVTARTIAQVVLWATVAVTLFIAVLWGRRLEQRTPWIKLGAAPLVGIGEQRGWELRFSWRAIPAVVAIVSAVVLLPRLLAKVRIGVALVITAISTGGISLLLALTDGESGVLEPVTHPTEYWAYLPRLRPGTEYFRTYVDRLQFMPVHYRGHPPLYPFMLKGLRNIGLSGPWPVALLSLFATSLIPVGVLTSLRVAIGGAAGDHALRRLAPFMAVAPFTIWATYSADAVFSAMGVAAVCFVLRARRSFGRNTRAWVRWAFTAGVSFALLAHASYGAAMFSFVFGGVALFGGAGSFEDPSEVGSAGQGEVSVHRRWPGRGFVPVAAAAALGALCVTAAFTAVGFWWVEGALATKSWYWKGTAQFRTWTYFSFANAGAALIALGPAFVVGLGHVPTGRRPSGRVFVFSSLVAIVAATMSQMTKGEVERIWLQFYPWLMVSALWIPEQRQRRWLWAQALVTLGLALALRTKW